MASKKVFPAYRVPKYPSKAQSVRSSFLFNPKSLPTIGGHLADASLRGNIKSLRKY